MYVVGLFELRVCMSMWGAFQVLLKYGRLALADLAQTVGQIVIF